jgi:hypothetical protein
MINKLSQKQRIINKLLKDGEVSRNSALSNFISRLGAIICRLEKEGWKFSAEYEKTEKGQDYIYRIIHCPYKKQEYINPITGQIITKYIK